MSGMGIRRSRERFINSPQERRGGLSCGPVVLWDWFVLDISYLLVLVGGSLVLRAKTAGVGTWVAFGSLSIAVGAFLFAATYGAQIATAEAATTPMMAMSAATNC